MRREGGASRVVRLAIVGGAILVAAFAIALATTAIAAAITGEWKRPPAWAVLAVPLVAVVVLPAVHRRADRLALRLLHGQRGEAYVELETFVTHAASTLAVDDVLPRLAETAARSVHGDRSEVRLLSAEGRRWTQVWPPGAPDLSAAADVQVHHAGAPVGEIAVATPAPLRAADLQLLDQLARPAGLALSTVRLTFELRERLAELSAGADELRASQERLVAARRHERERLRADTERLVTPRVDGTARALRRLRLAAPERPEELEPLIADVRASAGEALDALRSLSRGLVPPQLHELGPGSVLQAWIAELGLPAQVRGGDALDAIKEAPALESALYACCARAVAALAAGEATPITVELSADEGAMRFAVSQQRLEAGGDPLGADLRVELRDRVEALGGSIGVEDGAERVELRGELPDSGQRSPRRTPFVRAAAPAEGG